MADKIFLPIHSKKHGTKVVTLDLADLPIFRAHIWHVHPDGNTFYVSRNAKKATGRWGTVKLHQLLVETQPGQVVDHRDGNGLNNSRSNLRACTPSENLRNRGTPRTNTSGYKGVSWSPSSRKWKAAIRVDGVDHHLGVFTTKEAAYEAYCSASKALHGAFSRL
jgi:hypothetical protein